MKFKTREHLRQPRGHSGPSGIGGARPLVLLNWNQGVYPRNEGTAPRTDTWTNIGTPTLSVIGRRQGLALSDPSNAGGVQFGADVEFGRPTSAVPVWLAAIYTHVPYFNAGSSVNTFANYGTGAGGLDGGAIFHVSSSNQLRAWLMSIDVTTSWSAVDGQTYHLLVARDANRAGGLWIDGRLIGTGTSSTNQFPGASRVNLLSDAGLNERRARGVLHAYAYGEGDITAEAGRISSNLWQLFGKKRRIWVPVAAGGGPASYSLTAEQGSYTLTGQDAGLRATRTMAADQGSYTLTGQSANLLRGLRLVAAQGSYALTGQDAGLTRTYLLTAGQGSYALTGQDVGLLAARRLTAEQGSYALTGQAASLIYTAAGAYTLQCDAGTYSLTGQDAGLRATRIITAAQGSYSLTGQDATLTYTPVSASYTLTADSGSYSLTGQAAAFVRTWALTAESGSYAMAGQPATLTYSGAPAPALNSAPPIGHGPALATRTPPALRRRAPNLSTRTR